MEISKEELAEAITGYQIGSGYYSLDIGPTEAREIANIVLHEVAKKKAEHQKKLNIVHAYYCAVFNEGNMDHCDCESTTTLDQGCVEVDGS